MSVDIIGDFLTIIRNGILASKRFVVAPYSKMKFEIAQILEQEGFVKSISIVEDDAGFKQIKIVLKYVDGESAIHEIDRVSVPGRRVYKNISGVKPVIGGLGISILSTNKGIMTNKKALQSSAGGEIICTVW